MIAFVKDIKYFDQVLGFGLEFAQLNKHENITSSLVNLKCHHKPENKQRDNLIFNKPDNQKYKTSNYQT